MSRHSFRSFVLYFVALSFIIDTKLYAFTIRKAYNATEAPPQDLSVGESLQLEVRHDLKSPNGIEGGVLNKSSESSTTMNNNNAHGIGTVISSLPQIATTTGLSESYTNGLNYENSSVNNESEVLSKIHLTPNHFTLQSLKISKNNESNTNENLTLTGRTNDNSMTVSVEGMKSKAVPSYISSSDKIISVTDDSNGQTTQAAENENVSYSANTFFTASQATDSTMVSINNTNNDVTLPPWKKYTVIDRKRIDLTIATTVSTGMSQETITESSVTLKDSITSHSITLERTAGDLHPSMLETSAPDFVPSTPNYQDISDTQHLGITTKYEEPEILTLETVFSKRAGFLNLSSKSKENDRTTESNIFDTTTGSDIMLTSETNLDESIKSTFADAPGSQRYLEYAVKNTLLEETSLNNNEEITKQNRGEELNTETTSANVERFNTEVTYHETEPTPQTDVSNPETTPFTNASKIKSKKIYTINPNYKPMKKIEVQPPKTFMRDPDDNSWRNESISSLGIVFKPKNSSKPFTQVLKNKTETEWSNILSRDGKNDVPDLRERLEKIAQSRKTKKKKADIFGNIIYSDYEETNSSEEMPNTEINDVNTTSISTEEATTFHEIALPTLPILRTQTPNTVTTPQLITSTQSAEIITTTSTSESDICISTTATSIPLPEYTTTSTLDSDPPTTLITTEVTTTNNNLNFTKNFIPKQITYGPSTTEKPKKNLKFFDYYDGTDEDDSEYLELAKLELKKKNTAPSPITNVVYTTLPPLSHRFTSLPPYSPDRQPTIQYFPPRNTKPPKSNRYDNDVEKKIKNNMKKSSRKFVPITDAPGIPYYMLNSPLPNLLPNQQQHYDNLEQNTIKPDHSLLPEQLPTMYKSNGYSRNLYQTTAQPITTMQNNAYGVADPNKGFNRATYVIKSYKDFLEQAAKDYDYERVPEYIQYTDSPLRGITISDLVALGKDSSKTNPNFNYDYDVKFRKEVLQRFVDNLSHNEARYNDDFPVLYNNTVMHIDLAGNGGAVASSRAFLKGPYNPSDAKQGYARREPYDPNCDKCTVELSPAYELHYYVPDQEEKEEAEPKPTGITLP